MDRLKKNKIYKIKKVKIIIRKKIYTEEVGVAKTNDSIRYLPLFNALDTRDIQAYIHKKKPIYTRNYSVKVTMRFHLTLENEQVYSWTRQELQK